MRIRLGYDIRFEIPSPVAMVAQLNVHPSRSHDLLEQDTTHVDHSDGAIACEKYQDAFGNVCTRIAANPGILRLHSEFTIYDSGELDAYEPTATQMPVEQLPAEVLPFLLASRYCEVDLMHHTAFELFGAIAPGWARVEAISAWVHSHVRFGYEHARATKTALNVYTERTGVCRDFQHLAVTFCRCLNIPARYASGYLPDIGVPPGGPMDFSAWFEAYLDGRWWTFDARHHEPRIGRVLMVTGRDAVDAAITTSFGATTLTNFTVVAEEIAGEEVAAIQRS